MYMCIHMFRAVDETTASALCFNYIKIDLGLHLLIGYSRLTIKHNIRIIGKMMYDF